MMNHRAVPYVYLNPEPTGLVLQVGESEAALNSSQWQMQ